MQEARGGFASSQKPTELRAILPGSGWPNVVLDATRAAHFPIHSPESPAQNTAGCQDCPRCFADKTGKHRPTSAPSRPPIVRQRARMFFPDESEPREKQQLQFPGSTPPESDQSTSNSALRPARCCEFLRKNRPQVATGWRHEWVRRRVPRSRRAREIIATLRRSCARNRTVRDALCRAPKYWSTFRHLCWNRNNRALLPASRPMNRAADDIPERSILG